MGRNELFITIPNLFRCPISLDVMKSPVSLCTGVTYDRSSIQHWLESGHDTCPATMQVLSTKDFIPNLTLHRLINLWDQSSTRRLDSGFSSPASTSISEQEVRLWIEDIKNRRVESMRKILEFLKFSEENRRFLVKFEGFMEAIVGVLSSEGVEIQFLELTVGILDLISLQKGMKEKLQRLISNSNENCLSSLVSIIRNGNSKSKTEGIRVMESILLNNESKRFIAETHNLSPVLLRLLQTENTPALSDAVLSLLTCLTISRKIKIEMVKLGVVEVLTKMMWSEKASVSSIEKSLKLLSAVSRCRDGQAAISEEPNCVIGIVERVMKVSKRATEDAVMVLWSMCCLLRDKKVQEMVVKRNGLTKVLLVMQSEGEGNVKMMCSELVKVLTLSAGWKDGSTVMSYDTKTTHIMPC
ncbi:U-box domain-containing protein 28-like [Euphorbia lathyris]|uniref:U-box domain-containing protein 28-like n=1 Tax=Euphorbia lathyris TaxID=212925 RepID=UPI0033133FDB